MQQRDKPYSYVPAITMCAALFCGAGLSQAPALAAAGSDDFSAPALDEVLWTFVNPFDDAALTMTGTHVEIALPANGQTHDIWTFTNFVPRILQSMANADLDIVAKFDSPLTADFQSQGIVIEQDTDHLVRVEFHHWAGTTKVFVATIFADTATIRSIEALPIQPPMYLRVQRVQDNWTVWYSQDDFTWTEATTFNQPMTVSSAGVFAGNSGNTAHTALIDYFFDTQSPIDPEDAGLATVLVRAVGDGSVSLSPDLPGFAPGTIVDVAAAPAPGWVFSHWSGDLAGLANPSSITLTGDVYAAAEFDELPDVLPPIITNVVPGAGTTSATIFWTTDEPATSVVRYGPTVAYGNTVADGFLTTDHVLTLTGLISDTTYHFQVESADEDGNTATTGDLPFATDPIIPTGLVSDDFFAPALDGGVWTFVNPLGDASVSMTGAQAQIVLPASGSTHDVWIGANTVPRLMQAVANTDFEVEAKFESELTTNFQGQGILVEEDDANVIRIEMHYFAGSTNLFVASIRGDVATTHAFDSVPLLAPMFLRVGRVGDEWTVWYSLSGADWSVVASFVEPMIVSSVGVYASNTAGTAHVATIDYFFETLFPVTPEDDGLATLLVEQIGSGSISRTPDQSGYAAGTNVTVEAMPAPGWVFGQWSGDLGGSLNPATVTLDTDLRVSAEFVEVADVLPPLITNVQVDAGVTSTTITWTTDEAATSEVDYGLNSAYTDTAVDGTLTTSHSLTLTPLFAETVYHFEVVSADSDGNVGVSGDGTFTTGAPVVAGVVSDDFSNPMLDTATWTFVDPVGDATLTMTGSELQISLPAGSTHDLWIGNYAVPRLTQPIGDGDFEIEVKFDSPLTADYQSQGIVVEQDIANFLRIEFHHFLGRRNLFVASITGGSSSNHAFTPITLTPPMYMRVGRVGDQWTVLHSPNGVDWTVGASFVEPLVVSAVGVYAGNGSGAAHTARIDYFFDTAAPIIPEDGSTASVFIGVVGNGAVALNPDKPVYDAGEVVEITAVADPGWQFDHWIGDLAGAPNPATITIDVDVVATVVFIDVSDVDPPTISTIQSSVTSSSATITWITDEPATSEVNYGLTASYTDVVTDPTLRTNHSVTLPNLASDALHHFAVSSTDATGNVAASADQSFTTLPNAGPVIDVWYGDTQVFGDPGVSQRWINVLGNVSDPDGIDVLTFRLNGGPVQNLSLGPDTRRLLRPGDFNVEIAADDFTPGVNEVAITAFDFAGAETTKIITVDYVAPSVWPATFSIDWNVVGNITDVVQIVDGEWTIDNGRLRNTALGYDRVVAIGDRLWDDYEVVAEMTMHAIDPAGYQWPSVSPGFGMILRWPGHTAWDSAQPTWGWTPTGATIWYDAGSGSGLSLGGNDGLSQADANRVLDYDVTYVFKMRVQTMPGQGTFYAAKVWEKTLPEPADWDLSGLDGLSDGPSGSCALVAHHVDVTYGPVNIVPLADPNPPTISAIAITPSNTQATISWVTDEPATGEVAYGPSSAYENGVVTDLTPVVAHSITLTGLTTGQMYHVQVRSVDVDGNQGSGPDLVFTAILDVDPPVLSAISVAVGAGTAIISWTTDEPATGAVNYGLTSAYTVTISDSALTTNHQALLTQLSPDTEYHYEIVSIDLAGNASSSGDLTFSTQTGSAGAVTSDDFSQPVLDTGLWTMVDPLGDATVTMTGTQVRIDVPASGQAHDFWIGANNVARLMQTVGDGDFEIETKFESDVSTHFQSQGILIEQDPLHAIRVDFHNWGGQTKLFIATIFGSDANVRESLSIALAAPMYLRVRREGSIWTVRYSLDGVDWTTATTFPQPMIVTAVGVFAGNSDSTPHAAIIDYFFDTSAPIVPEDAGLPSVFIAISGAGTVTRNPDQPSYDVGTAVEITATPALGWEFDSWTGDLAGASNPTTIIVTDDVVGGVVFFQTADLTPPTISSIGVIEGDTDATITWTTDEAATGVVNYGLTAQYTDFVAGAALVIDHSVVLSGLAPGTVYHYEILSEDAAGNIASTGDLTFATTVSVSSGIASDEFDGAGLDAGVWTFEDPLADASLVMTGSALEIHVPANGQNAHDVWTTSNSLARIMQPVGDADFEVEAKFDSAVTTHFQSQGILVEQSSLDVVRAEFHNFNGQSKLFVVTIFNGSANIRTMQSLSLTPPMYLRVRREGDFWVVSHSIDGATWVVGVTFNQVMTPTRIGVFAGNSTDTPHTATVDYFRDLTGQTGNLLLLQATNKRRESAGRSLGDQR